MASMKVRVIKSYKSAYPEPISFEVGEAVSLGEMDDEYPGWIRVTTADGNTGWAPLKYLVSSGPNDAIARSQYSAQELSAEAGESLELIKQLDGWAWCLNDEGRHGWLPSALLQQI